MITLTEQEFYNLIENACESVKRNARNKHLWIALPPTIKANNIYKNVEYENIHHVIEIIKYIINAYVKAFNKKLTERQIASLNTSLLCDLQAIFKK